MRLKPIALATTGLLLLLSFSACRTHSSKSQTLIGYGTVKINHVAVMPFLAGNTALNADDQVQPALDCTLMEFCQAVNELGPGAENVLTGEMQRALELKLDDRVISLTRGTDVYDNLPQNRMVDTPRQLARRFGKTVGADHVILGSVWRYRDRMPNAPDIGSSVAFSVYLLEVENGRRVWRGRFDKTQQALSDDLRDAGMFFQEGARWLSAAELARYGITQVMQTFPEAAE